MSTNPHSDHLPHATKANAQHSQHDVDFPPSGFWRSKVGLVAVAFLLIAAFFLFFEHRAHALGVLPYLLILACPLLHIFMHGGDGSRGGHGKGSADRSRLSKESEL